MNPEPKENFFKELFKFILIAVCIVIPVRAYIAQPFIVSGASMDPTFATGQYLIVDEVTYHFEKPERGQVIIFKYPLDPKTYFIKRIIGLPGETVSITNGVVMIKNAEHPDGFALTEPYISRENASAETYTASLGANEYFVMGDNRLKSSDSRIWGPLDKSYIIGRPIIRLLPVSMIDLFPGAQAELQ